MIIRPQRNILDIIKDWLDISVEKFLEALDDYEIGKLDGELWRSIAGEIAMNGGDPEAAIIKFLQYGRMVDMGVGRGMPIGSKKALGEQKFSEKRNDKGQLKKRPKRKPKPWYSKTKYREVMRLREIMAEEIGDMTFAEVETALKNGLLNEFSA